MKRTEPEDILITSAMRCASTTLCTLISELTGARYVFVTCSGSSKEDFLELRAEAITRARAPGRAFCKSHLFSPISAEAWLGETPLRVIAPRRNLEDSIVSRILYARRRIYANGVLGRVNPRANEERHFIEAHATLSDADFVNRFIQASPIIGSYVGDWLRHNAFLSEHPQVLNLDTGNGFPDAEATANQIAAFIGWPVNAKAVSMLNYETARRRQPPGHIHFRAGEGRTLLDGKSYEFLRRLGNQKGQTP